MGTMTITSNLESRKEDSVTSSAPIDYAVNQIGRRVNYLLQINLFNN